MADLLAGWSRVEITPSRGCQMAGYIARHGAASGGLDPLFVRALVLRQGRLTAAILVADLLLISNRWARRIQRRLARVLRARPERIILAATHTHSGPLTDAYPFQFFRGEFGKRERRYAARVEGRMERAVKLAAARLRPAKVSAARRQIHDVASDRNHPARSRSQPLRLLRFETGSGAALLGVYGCHSTVLGAANTLISGDLHGAITRQLERDVDVALLANGAAANISTRFTRRSQEPPEVLRLAGIFLRQAAAARFRPARESPLSATTCRLRLPVRDFAAVKMRGGEKSGRLAVVEQEALGTLDHLRHSRAFRRKSISTVLTLLRIGGITFAALPFELYADTGDALWARSRVISVCYANGNWGYVPSARAGKDDYEALSSAFDVRADEALRRAVAGAAQGLMP
jgi:neutral ceramidase